MYGYVCKTSSVRYPDTPVLPSGILTSKVVLGKVQQWQRTCQTHTCSAFVYHPNTRPNYQTLCSAVTKQWLLHRKRTEGRWKNTDEAWSIIYEEVLKLKKQVLTIQIFAFIIFKQWPSLFQVINKQQRSAEREIAVNMVSVFLDETHCNLVDVSQKRYEGIYVPTKLHGVASWATVIFMRKRTIWGGWISQLLSRCTHFCFARSSSVLCYGNWIHSPLPLPPSFFGLINTLLKQRSWHILHAPSLCLAIFTMDHRLNKGLSTWHWQLAPSPWFRF